MANDNRNNDEVIRITRSKRTSFNGAGSEPFFNNNASGGFEPKYDNSNTNSSRGPLYDDNWFDKFTNQPPAPEARNFVDPYLNNQPRNNQSRNTQSRQAPPRQTPPRQSQSSGNQHGRPQQRPQQRPAESQNPRNKQNPDGNKSKKKSSKSSRARDERVDRPFAGEKQSVGSPKSAETRKNKTKKKSKKNAYEQPVQQKKAFFTNQDAENLGKKSGKPGGRPERNNRSKNSSSRERFDDRDRNREKKSSFTDKQNEKKENSKRRRIDHDNDAFKSREAHKTPDSKKGEIQASKRKKHRIINGIILTAVFLVLAGGLFGFYAKSRLIVNTVYVTMDDDSVYSEEEVKNASAIIEGSSMLLINKEKAASGICETLPYIGNVVVNRQWPDVVEIKIVETTDRFALILGKKYVWLDENGKVLSATKKKIEKGSIKVIGFDKEQDYKVGTTLVPSPENKEMYDLIQEISSASYSTGLAIKEIEFLEDGNIKLRNTNYVSILAKPGVNFVYKFKGLKDLMKGKKYSSAHYFDIRGINEIRENHGEYKPKSDET